MRIAALYDIHGNLPALDAVLADVRKANVDQIVVGGDVVPGPMPAAAIERLIGLDIPVRFIHGNGDREVLAHRAGDESTPIPEAFREVIRWSGRQLTANHVEALSTWPSTLRVDIPDLGRVLFCHATPRNDTDIFTRLTTVEKLIPVFVDVDADVIVCGHTHMQFDRVVGKFRIVNAGSVGMPFGQTGADWLILGRDVEHRHTSYDLECAAAVIRSTSYPQADEFVANNLLTVPSEQEILDRFSKAELK